MKLNKKQSRLRRSKPTRYKLRELEMTRLSVHRTPQHIYAQIISGDGAKTIISASTLDKSLQKSLKASGNIEAAKSVGKLIAERALKEGINKVAFDRSGFAFHGRIKALADAAREAGLEF